MSTRTRSLTMVLAVVVGLGLVAAVGPVVTARPALTAAGAIDPDAPSCAGGVVEPDYRFLSAPDFLNADIADLRRTPRWRRGLPNSTSPAWERSLRRAMDAFAGEEPDDVLVAGDLVNGHWGRDARRTGIFGPVGNEARRRAAVSRAARTYYGQWLRRFDQRGLPVHVAVGDHEIGDNPWRGSGVAEFRRRNLDHFKREFARRVLRPGRYAMRPPGPANRTAYARWLQPRTLLVTVDVFERTEGNVIPRLDRQQLAWLDRLLGRTADRADWVIVQGHVPVAGPVASTSSSGLYYRGRTGSPFWRTMARHGVDLYLNGEVHDNTVLRRNGIIQISHGGRLGDVSRDGVGNQSYLVADVTGTTMRLRLKRFRPRSASRARLWQTIVPQSPRRSIEILPTPDCLGVMRLDADGRLRDATGALTPR